MIPARITVHVSRYTGKQRDPLGNISEGWGDPEPLKVQGIAPGAMVEPGEANRDASRIAWTLYCPAGTEVGERDRIDIAGQTYEVAGRPKPFDQGPWDWTRGLGGTVIELEAVTG
ncbi:MAG: hypothetical protein L0G99_04410 [Propionibacteriales bacterium]|nr:hypothetical protein [Propionibacteriales bacterium]